MWGAGGARGLGVASVSPSSFGAASGSPPGLRDRADSGRGVVKGRVLLDRYQGSQALALTLGQRHKRLAFAGCFVGSSEVSLRTKH